MDAIQIVRSTITSCFDQISHTLSKIEKKTKWIALGIFSILSLGYLLRRLLKPRKYQVLNGQKIPFKRFISKEDLVGNVLKLSDGTKIPDCQVRETVFSDNKTHLIGFFNETFTGRGEKQLATGESYKGEFREGKMHGLGCFKINNNWRIEGPFKDDALSLGRLVVTAGEKERSIMFVKPLKQTVTPNTTLEGWFDENLNGFGSLTNCMFSCTGEFKFGRIQNDSEGRYADGSHYKGDFQDNKPHGEGVLTSIFGSKLMGYFQCGHFVRGEVTLSNGETYNVSYKEMTKDSLFITGVLDESLNGVGIIADKLTPFSKEGELKEGNLNGKGKFCSKDKTVYEGCFRNDKLHGEGEIRSHEGFKIKGQFEENVLEKGTVTLSDGWSIPNCKYRNESLKNNVKIDGTFDAKLSGVGEISTSKAIYKGEFKEGVLLKGITHLLSGTRIESLSGEEGVFKVTLSNNNVFSECRLENKSIAAGILVDSVHGYFDERLNGVGTVKYWNGDMANGEFMEGNLHGLGEIVRGEQRVAGKFEKDKCVEKDDNLEKFSPYRQLLNTKLLDTGFE